MRLKAVAIGLIASGFLISSGYAEQSVNPGGGQQGLDQQQSGRPGSDMGGGQSSSDIQSGSQQGSDRGSQPSVGSSTPDQGSGAERNQQGPNSETMQSGSQNKESGWASLAGVQQIQQKLNEQGYPAGPVDGKFGPKTKEALRQFQQAKGLQPTGQVDQQTVVALGIQGQSGSQQGGSANPSGSTDQGGGSQKGVQPGATPPNTDMGGGSIQGSQGGSSSSPDLGSSQSNGGVQGSDPNSDLGSNSQGSSGSSSQQGDTGQGSGQSGTAQ